MSQPPLKDYQAKAITTLVRNGAGGLFMECGLGKSRTILEVLNRLGPSAWPALIIAPKAVALNTWPAEIKKWFPEWTVAVACGTKAQAVKAFDQEANITVINYERLELLVSLKVASRFGACIIDESSKIKNASAKRTKRMLRLSHLWAHRFVLSGTPTPNGNMEELWSQVFMIDDGKRLGKSLSRFREWFSEAHIEYFGQQKVRQYQVKTEAVPEIQARIGDVCISALARDHLSVSSQVVQHSLTLPPRKQAVYDKLKEDAILTLETAEDALFETGPIINRLTQFTSGAVYVTTDDKRVAQQVHDVKQEFVKELVESINDQVIICYNYKFERDILTKLYPNMPFFGEGGDDAMVSAVDAWNARQIPVAGMQPARAGHGLNLQEGGHTIIWFSLPWSYEHYQQANGRLVRRGQEQPVMIHHLITQATADGYVEAKVRGKGRINDSLLSHLKEPPGVA